MTLQQAAGSLVGRVARACAGRDPQSRPDLPPQQGGWPISGLPCWRADRVQFARIFVIPEEAPAQLPSLGLSLPSLSHPLSHHRIPTSISLQFHPSRRARPFVAPPHATQTSGSETTFSSAPRLATSSSPAFHPAMADKYSALKVPELKKLLQEKSLPVAGNKADLIARLVEHDKAQEPKKPGQ